MRNIALYFRNAVCLLATLALSVGMLPAAAFAQQGGGGDLALTVGTASEGGEIVQISMGDNHSAALMSDGSLWTWGGNYDGELGDGTNEDSNVPVKVMDDVVFVSAGNAATAAIKSDGSLWTWGGNYYGELGDGTNEDSNVPVRVMDDVAFVSAGDATTAAIKSDGSLWTWGCNDIGQLGDGNTIWGGYSTPVRIMGDATSVCMGGEHSAAIQSDGSLWTWGNNSYGQLGVDGCTYSAIPIEITGDATSVSLDRVQDGHSAAIKSDGSLWVWGCNSYGQIGNESTEDQHLPVKIMDDVIGVSLGDRYSSAVKSDGGLWTWGCNERGQLGDGSRDSRTTPAKIMDDVTAVSTGGDHSAAIKSDGSLWVWGHNGYGELGDGTYESRYSPVCIFRDGEWLYGSGSGDDPVQEREDDSQDAISLAGASVTVASATYSGSALKPTVTVKLGATTLKQGTDYKVAYSNNVNASSAAVAKVTGIGSYTGSVSKKFKIAKHPMDKDSVTAKLAKTRYAWTGKAIKPGISVYFNGKLMKKGTDYTVSYLSNKNVGEGTVMVTGKGNFTSTARLFGFKIVRAKQPLVLYEGSAKLNSDSMKFKYKDAKAGKTFTLVVKGVKESAPIKVTSSKSKVATVKKKSSNKYVVTLKGVGTTKIKIQTTKATKHYAKTTKTIKVVVADRKVPTITVKKAITKNTTDSAFNLGAKCSGNMPIAYTSKNKDIATVDKRGKITLTGKQGTATIKLSVKGNDFFKSGSVDVVIKVVGIRAPIDLDKGGWKAGSYNGHDSGEAVQAYATDWQKDTPKKDSDRGMPVYAMADGTITYVDPSSGSIQIRYSKPLTLTNGYTIKANHWYSWYGHLRTFKDEGKKIDNTVKGDKTKKGLTSADKNKVTVKKGEIVGYVWNTKADNYHFHFSVYGFNGTINNPWSSCKPIMPYWIADCGLDNEELYPKKANDQLHREFTTLGVKRNLLKDPIPGKSYWEKK